MNKSYDLIKKISSGQFGEIYLARDKKSHDIVAIKKIYADINNSERMIQILREVNSLKQLKGFEYIVQYINDYIYSDHIMIVTEYCSMNLSFYLKNHQLNLNKKNH